MKTVKHIKLVILAFLIVSHFLSCDAQQNDQYSGKPFNESIKTEVKIGLHIVPVTINDKTYRFLFDTGAPTSISEEIQDLLKFKVVDRGNIVDSDKNKIRVKYVRVDSIFVGDVRFKNVKAFVADFKANPTLGCLGLDGILGSNMMQACNWKIDYVSQRIDLSNSAFLTEEKLSVDFRRDKQYDIMVDLEMGKAKVTNMKIDYGNNSSISVPANVFNFLIDEDVISERFVEVGYNQGGLGANPVAMERSYGYLDSLSIGNFVSTDLAVKTGKSGLVGREFLSRYIVAINWSEKKLRFQPHESWEDSRPTFGYSSGLNSKGEIVLFGVTKGSDAERKGLETGMKVIRIDTIDFSKGSTYCEYIDYVRPNQDVIEIEVEDKNGQRLTVNLVKSLLGK